MGKGMTCPKCGSDDTGVVDSRASTDGVRRRRHCLSCQHRFTTFERILGDPSKDLREQFDVVASETKKMLNMINRTISAEE